MASGYPARMKLSAYFSRIGYSGPVTPDLTTLEAVMRAHAAAVPFENLDVQLGRPLGTELPAIYAKLVERRRGGWCYEQNGLLGWALGEMGFDVTRIAAGVMRHMLGDTVGNHLTLIVNLDEPWLVDVGFGGTQAMPLPLAAGEHDHAPFTVSLAEADGYWRFSERFAANDPFSFDFHAVPADEALLAGRCQALQTDPESPFVQNLVVQQRQGERHLTLRGRMLVERDAAGEAKHLVQDPGEFVALLRDRFGLDLPEAAGLWDKVCARHAVLFPDG